ncbi:hypothetical protein WN48_08762 [Eufriesea mexicana]|nr:hypothetical protein WN48_08762 [Eufriesea mexicana]
MKYTYILLCTPPHREIKRNGPRACYVYCFRQATTAFPLHAAISCEPSPNGDRLTPLFRQSKLQRRHCGAQAKRCIQVYNMSSI